MSAVPRILTRLADDDGCDRTPELSSKSGFDVELVAHLQAETGAVENRTCGPCVMRDARDERDAKTGARNEDFEDRRNRRDARDRGDVVAESVGGIRRGRPGVSKQAARQGVDRCAALLHCMVGITPPCRGTTAYGGESALSCCDEFETYGETCSVRRPHRLRLFGRVS